MTIYFTLRELIIVELIFADGGSQKTNFALLFFFFFFLRIGCLEKILLNLFLRMGDNRKYKMFISSSFLFHRFLLL